MIKLDDYLAEVITQKTKRRTNFSVIALTLWISKPDGRAQTLQFDSVNMEVQSSNSVGLSSEVDDVCDVLDDFISSETPIILNSPTPISKDTPSLIISSENGGAQVSIYKRYRPSKI